MLALALLAASAMLPSSYEVERAVTCSGTPADIHPHVEDFHRWSAWSPELREAERIEYEGPAKGVDARLHWRNAEQDGTMVVRASLAARGVWIDRDLAGRGRARVAILYEPVSERETKVVWIERGRAGAGPFRRIGSFLAGRAATTPIEARLAGLRELVGTPPTEPVAPRAESGG